MITLLNKLLAFFHLKLVYTKPDTSFVKETVKFMNENPKQFSGDDYLYEMTSGYVGDINYLKERVEGEFPQVSGRTYFQENITKDKYFFNYEGEKLTAEELEAKVND